MKSSNVSKSEMSNWHIFSRIIAEAMLIFYIATFCLVMYLYHRPANDIWCAGAMGVMYVFILFAVIKRLIAKLPLAVLILMVPIAPLFALIVVVTMIPILQILK